MTQEQTPFRGATEDDVGHHCFFFNPYGKRFDALITAVWGPSCINVVIVVDDPKQKDNYGRKTYKGYTSVNNGNAHEAHGYFWLWPDQERKIPTWKDEQTANSEDVTSGF